MFLQMTKLGLKKLKKLPTLNFRYQNFYKITYIFI